MTEIITALYDKYQPIIFSIGSFLLGYIVKIIYERITLSYKLKKEYNFSQRKKTKEEIGKNKTYLLNAFEDLNHRLWNLKKNIDKGWHKTSNGTRDYYYLNSSVYRILLFFYWTIKTEQDVVTIDTTIVDKKDITFLKWIKTFKNIFTDVEILSKFEYSGETNSHHFYKNDLIKYFNFMQNGDKCIDYESFILKIKDEEEKNKIIEIFNYISNINDDHENKNLYIINSLHLLLVRFLNIYGHDYQKTSIFKSIRLQLDNYYRMNDIKYYEKFLKRNKIFYKMGIPNFLITFFKLKKKINWPS